MIYVHYRHISKPISSRSVSELYAFSNCLWKSPRTPCVCQTMFWNDCEASYSRRFRTEAALATAPTRPGVDHYTALQCSGNVTMYYHNMFIMISLYIHNYNYHDKSIYHYVFNKPQYDITGLVVEQDCFYKISTDLIESVKSVLPLNHIQSLQFLAWKFS